MESADVLEPLGRRCTSLGRGRPVVGALRGIDGRGGRAGGAVRDVIAAADRADWLTPPIWYCLVMSQRAAINPRKSTIARTIRIPAALRKRIAADAERCGRSFEGQVIALLRRHFGEDVDIAPGPAGILALAVASLADIPASERDVLTRKLEERER
jgi:hypothetical protein